MCASIHTAWPYLSSSPYRYLPQQLRRVPLGLPMKLAHGGGALQVSGVGAPAQHHASQGARTLAKGREGKELSARGHRGVGEVAARTAYLPAARVPTVSLMRAAREACTPARSKALRSRAQTSSPTTPSAVKPCREKVGGGWV